MAVTTLTAMAAAVVAVTATPETTAVAMAAPRAATVTANATEPPRNDGARGRAGATAKTIARAIAFLSAMARFATAKAAAEVAGGVRVNTLHRAPVGQGLLPPAPTTGQGLWVLVFAGACQGTAWAG